MNVTFRQELTQLILKHKINDTVDGIQPDYIVMCVQGYIDAQEKTPVVDLTEDKEINEAIIELKKDFYEKLEDVPEPQETFEGNDHTNDGAVELPAEGYVDPDTREELRTEEGIVTIEEEVKIEDLTPEHQKKAKKVLTEVAKQVEENNGPHKDRFDKEGWITYNKALASTDNFIKRGYIKALIRRYPLDEELPNLLIQWS